MPTQTQAAKEVNSTSRVWLPIAVIALVVVVIGLFTFRSHPVSIRYAEVKRGSITSSISTNGKIEPVRNFEAHSPMQTSVVKVWVAQGDRVKPGQLLLELDDSGARSDAARAAAQVKAAQADLNAIRTGGTHEEVLTNQADLTKANADLQAAQRNLDAMKRLQQSGAAELVAAENQQSFFVARPAACRGQPGAG